MIDRNLFSLDRLLDVLLDTVHGNVNNWMRLVEIVPDYIPPFPRPETRPTIQVRCLVDPTEPLPAPGVATSRYSYLRSSVGWKSSGYFWDGYGSEFYCVEHALLAVVHAPVPPALLKPVAWAKLEDLAVVRPRLCKCGGVDWGDGCRRWPCMNSEVAP